MQIKTSMNNVETEIKKFPDIKCYILICLIFYDDYDQ